MRTRLLGFLLVVALMAAGCGGGHSSSAAGPTPPASTPNNRTSGTPTNAVKMPIAFDPPPTHATTYSGSEPTRSAYWVRASSPITRWRSRTSIGNGCGPTTEPIT